MLASHNARLSAVTTLSAQVSRSSRSSATNAGSASVAHGGVHACGSPPCFVTPVSLQRARLPRVLRRSGSRGCAGSRREPRPGRRHPRRSGAAARPGPVGHPGGIAGCVGWMLTTRRTQPAPGRARSPLRTPIRAAPPPVRALRSSTARGWTGGERQRYGGPRTAGATARHGEHPTHGKAVSGRLCGCRLVPVSPGVRGHGQQAMQEPPCKPNLRDLGTAEMPADLGICRVDAAAFCLQQTPGAARAPVRRDLISRTSSS